MKKRLKDLRKEKHWSRYFLMIFGMMLALFCLLLLVAKIMSYGAAELFNYAASRQEMLRGRSRWSRSPRISMAVSLSRSWRGMIRRGIRSCVCLLGLSRWILGMYSGCASSLRPSGRSRWRARPLRCISMRR